MYKDLDIEMYLLCQKSKDTTVIRKEEERSAMRSEILQIIVKRLDFILNQMTKETFVEDSGQRLRGIGCWEEDRQQVGKDRSRNNNEEFDALNQVRDGCGFSQSSSTEGSWRWKDSGYSARQRRWCGVFENVCVLLKEFPKAQQKRCYLHYIFYCLHFTKQSLLYFSNKSQPHLL